MATEWRTWREGRCLVFDDSFEHEVVHPGSAPRVVLIADLWHPEFEEPLRRQHLHGRHLRRYSSALVPEAGQEPHLVDAVEVRFLEAELRGLPQVQEAAVTMHFEAATGQQTLLAYVESAADCGLGPSEVCALCSERLRRYEVDSLALAVRQWPRAPDGTIDRARLPPPPRELLPGSP